MNDGTYVLIIMQLIPIIVFGYFHLLNNGFFDKFKRKKK
jgi:hypothetical protein